MRNTKAITISVPIDLLELIRVLRTEPKGRYEGRKNSQICSMLIAERLSDMKKENLMSFATSD